mmetsp:Transcript_99653/g.316334  ORF Transcript_99653/g.316334 Transcript_99653/m.316334 type:complete len:324 (-) Transcript_99653:47-1018(-)
MRSLSRSLANGNGRGDASAQESEAALEPDPPAAPTEEAAANELVPPPSQKATSDREKVAAPPPKEFGEREQAWAQLHADVLEHMRAHLSFVNGSCCRLLLLPARLISAQLPGRPQLSSNMFRSRALRVLTFSCNLIGATMLGCVFFEASGIATRRSSPRECEGDGESSFGEEIGRLLAIGLVARLVAGLPVSVIEGLQTRQIVHVPYEGCPEAQKQLRIWRNQDVMAWVLGASYLLFAIFFCVVFLANVAPGDTTDWAISGAISIAQGLLVLPIAQGFCLTVLLACALQVMSCRSAGRRRDHAQATMNRVCERGNMLLPVVQI